MEYGLVMALVVLMPQFPHISVFSEGTVGRLADSPCSRLEGPPALLLLTTIVTLGLRRVVCTEDQLPRLPGSSDPVEEANTERVLNSHQG